MTSPDHLLDKMAQITLASGDMNLQPNEEFALFGAAEALYRRCAELIDASFGGDAECHAQNAGFRAHVSATLGFDQDRLGRGQHIRAAHAAVVALKARMDAVARG